MIDDIHGSDIISIMVRVSVVYLLFVILCVRSGGGFCLSLGWGTLDMALVPQFDIELFLFFGRTGFDCLKFCLIGCRYGIL